MQTIATPFVIAIAGGSGAGKSTLVNAIREAAGQIALLDQDSYYFDCGTLSVDAIVEKNFDHPSSIDQDLQIRHLQGLLSGQGARKPGYCFESHRRKACVYLVSPAPLVLVEGTLALWNAALRSLSDLKIYVDVGPDIRFIRRLQRDTRERGFTVESSIRQYLNSVRPMHEEFVEPTKAFADLLIDGTQSVAESVNRIWEVLGKRTAATGRLTNSRLDSSDARLDATTLDLASPFTLTRAVKD